MAWDRRLGAGLLLFQVVGLAAVASAVVFMETAWGGNAGSRLLLWRGLWLAVACLVFVAAARAPERWVGGAAAWAPAAAAVAVAALYAPGDNYHRFSPWLYLGEGWPRVRVSALASAAAVLWVGWVARGRAGQETRPYLGLAGAGAIPLLACTPRDFSGTFFALWPVMAAIVAGAPGARARWLAAGAAPLLVVGWAALAFARDGARLAWSARRILAWLHPEADPEFGGYHLGQSLIAVGSQGLLGGGLGWSVQKLTYLPDPHGASLFAMLAEETGMVGVTAVLGLAGWLGWRLLRRMAADSPVARAAAAGAAAWLLVPLVWQGFASVGWLPITAPAPAGLGGGGISMMLLGLLAGTAARGVALPVTSRAIRVFQWGVTAVLIILASRVAWIQTVRHPELARVADRLHGVRTVWLEDPVLLSQNGGRTLRARRMLLASRAGGEMEHPPGREARRSLQEILRRPLPFDRENMARRPVLWNARELSWPAVRPWTVYLDEGVGIAPADHRDTRNLKLTLVRDARGHWFIQSFSRRGDLQVALQEVH